MQRCFIAEMTIEADTGIVQMVVAVLSRVGGIAHSLRIHTAHYEMLTNMSKMSSQSFFF